MELCNYVTGICHVLNEFVELGLVSYHWLQIDGAIKLILTMFLATGARRDAVDTNILKICYFVLVLGGSLKRKQKNSVNS